MLKIAIIQFPGLNTEYETRREINKAGMQGEFFRWNESPAKLEKYDGYVIGGGFSYEDRGRAGVIASLDPIIKTIKAQAEKGKPVLGICNGAQILLESGLIPGVDGNKLAMALAPNKRMLMRAHSAAAKAACRVIEGEASAKPMRESGSASSSKAELINQEVIGTGYYNAWVNLKCSAKPETSFFTLRFNPHEVIRAPVAHAEGRFTTELKELVEKLSSNGQIAFRYCTPHGVITEDFPINPNGAVFNIAAICNPAGNVMAIMPHLERSAIASEKLFTSLRDSLLEKRKSKDASLGLGIKKRVRHIAVSPLKLFPLPVFQRKPQSLELFVSLIITDNEAETFELTLKKLGFPKVSLKRATHIELSYKGKLDLQKTMRKLVQSGILLNTNKEKLVYDAKREKIMPEVPAIQTTLTLLVRERQDFVGMSKLSTIQKRLKMNEITGVQTGTLWKITFPTKSKNVAMEELKKLVNTHLFFNPHRQEALVTTFHESAS